MSSGSEMCGKDITLKKPNIFLFIGFLSLALVDCRLPLRRNIMVVGNEPLPGILEKYQLAIETYENGAYLEACDKFEVIRTNTTDKIMARKALFGLACARLMAAETPEAYQKALELWETWVTGAPRVWDRENPLLLAPLIREKLLVSNISLAESKSNEQDKDQMVPRWLLVSTNAELSKVKEQLAEESRSTQQSQKKIVGLEKEIKRLKEQIKALETIDQKIQKKKNAIPSAD